MPVPLIAAAVATIGTAFAQRGLDVLGSLFRGALDKGTQEVADLIKDKTGIDVNNVADGKLDDAQWAKLKEFEFEYQSRLLEYQQSMEASRLEEERLHQADRADARSMQKEALKQDDVFSKRFIYYYSIGITILTFIFIFKAAFGDPQHQNSRVVDTVLGFLLGVSLSAIIQYFYGSSAGSSRKSQVIDEQLKEATRITARSQGQERGQP
ncbi:MAG: hypothetical protein ACK530_01550 [Alphaproteobacteria bacterium]|jgi:hypothetical protein